ncbi:MAG: 50S ribosomal protein L15 [Planctomycetota bacterium]|jgi:large subunit ribosomal protein L15
MNLNDVRKTDIGRKHKFRRGRGEGSGLGRQSGKGHKGQKSRSGVSFTPYFEGGQMPNIRRLPKRGFNNKNFKTVYAVINVGTLSGLFQDGDAVDPDALRARGLVKGRVDGVKILGNGEMKRKLTVRAHRFTKSAGDKITAAGGTFEEIE